MARLPEFGPALELERINFYPLVWLKYGISTSALQTRTFDSDMSLYAREHFAASGLVPYEINPHHDLHEAEDLKLLAELGVSHLRQSFEWAEWFPDNPHDLNPAAVKKTIDYINKCKNHGINVYPMLSHFAAPTWLKEQGGWWKRKNAYHFERFVKAFLDNVGDLLEPDALIGVMNEPLTLAAYLMAGKCTDDEKLSPLQMYLKAQTLISSLLHFIRRGNFAVNRYRHQHQNHFEPVTSTQLSPIYAMNPHNPLDRAGARLASYWQNTMFLKKLKGNVCAIQYYRPSAVRLTLPSSNHTVDELNSAKTNQVFCFEVTTNGIGIEEFRGENGWPVDVQGLYQSIIMAHKCHPEQKIIIFEEGYGGLKKPKNLSSEDAVSWKRRDEVVRIYQILINFLTIYAVKAREGIEVFGNFHWTLTGNNELGLLHDFGLVAWDPATDERTAHLSYYVYQKICHDKGVDLAGIYQLMADSGIFLEKDIANLKSHIVNALQELGLSPSN